ncbi:MAG: phenylalanine--tRNA ligase subunit beta [Candidatus Anstonellaceae archaeon]
MAAIKVSIKELEELSHLKIKELEEILTSIGVPIESKDSDNLELEITPNRPDLLSVEGLARACYCFKKGVLPNYRAKNSKINLFVDNSVKDVRPFIGGALIENVKLNQNFLESIIQLQEKIHQTLGRKRKKVAIGLHDISKAKPPFYYFATSSLSISFIPLGFDEPLNCLQILEKHPKGIEYRGLINSKFPLLKDSASNILSFPPIINSEFTKITPQTKSIFIDCTGTDQNTVLFVVNIFAALFADRGATVYQIKINNRPYTLFKKIKTKYNPDFANKILGVNLNLQEQKKLLLKMGHILKGKFVFSPAFRTDILDQIDIVEDLAIAYGYNNFKPIFPEFFSIGKEKEEFENISELLVGSGFLEVCSWILTNKKVLQKANCTENLLEVSNPLTEDFSVLRPFLYPNFLEIFSISKSSKMPQKIFEIGPIIQDKSDKIIQQTNACFALCSPKANITEFLGVVSGIFKSMGIDYKIEQTNHPSFISGRVGKIIVNDLYVGLVGEVHPEVLEKFSIEQPVVVCELFLDELKKLI